MSGIEVLGLVLGAIPLLISAFEHMRDACEARDLLVHFKAKHSKCWNDVKDEELVFRLHLRKLLLPLVKIDVLENDEIDALMLDAGGSNWRDVDLDAALQRRLGEAHDRYFENLREITKILHKLLMTLGYQLSPFQERLKAMKDARGESVSTRTRVLLEANAKFVGQQIGFAAKKASREELMSDLRKRIQKLETFLAMSDEVTTLQEQNTAVSQKSIKALLQYGQQANCLYSLIYNCWRCSCKQSHYAHLLLQHHTGAPFELKMLLLYAPKGSPVHTNMPPWQQQGLQILQAGIIDLRKAGTGISSMSAGRVLNHQPAAAIVKKALSCSKPRRLLKSASVRFNLPSARTDDISKEEGSGNTIGAKKLKLDHDEETSAASVQSEIGDLCKTLASCGMMTGCVGSLTDTNMGRRYQVLSQPRQKIIADEISLHDVLDPTHRPRFSRLTRFQIALKVASSHLKLVSTKWARTQWESKDIRFPYTASGTIMSDDPYVSADFRDRDSETEKPPTKTDRSFACLGIMLLELLFGETLEEHDLWQQLGADKTAQPLFRLMVARAWADAAEGETGKPFSSVIMWCLNDSPATLEDDGWRKDLAERVVLPLEKCCEWGQARPP